MKKQKPTVKNVNQLKTELGEMLTQFQNIKIDKKVKAKTSKKEVKKTKVNKKSTFFSDDFVADDFFDTKSVVAKKEKSKDIPEKPESELEAKKPHELDGFQIILDDEHQILENKTITESAEATTEISTDKDTGLDNLEVDFAEIASELKNLESDINKSSKTDESIKEIAKNEKEGDNQISQEQAESYLTIKQKLDLIKSSIEKDKAQTAPEKIVSNKVIALNPTHNKKHTTKKIVTATKKATPVIEKKTPQNSISKTTAIKKEVPKKSKKTDSLTIAILILVVIVLSITWFSFLR